jgi:hypothetical protein
MDSRLRGNDGGWLVCVCPTDITYVVKAMTVELPNQGEASKELEPITLPDKQEIDVSAIPFERV